MGSFQLSQTGGVTVVSIAGDIGPQDGFALLREAAEAVQPGSPVLVDARNAHSASYSTGEIYESVRRVASLGPVFKGRMAILLNYDGLLDLAQFYEASATVKGLNVRVFFHEPLALQWLREERG